MSVNSLLVNNDFAAIDSLNCAHLGVELQVLRLDTLSQPISGNKYFKLKNNILYAFQNGYKQLISFGGAYSNHIHALALAGKHYGIKTVGVIRGERVDPLNPTLADAQEAGMSLHFVSREEYRLRNDQSYLQKMKQKLGPGLFIPEGGSNLHGVKACGEIVEHINHAIGSEYDYLALPCGTGATMAGIVSCVPEGKVVLGFPVLKTAGHLYREVTRFLDEMGIAPKASWQIEEGYHFGGYARLNRALVSFVTSFEREHKIKLDHIYTGKCFYGLFDLIEKQQIPQGSRIVAIHTGGLQGERGIQKQLNKLTAGHNSQLTAAAQELM